MTVSTATCVQCRERFAFTTLVGHTVETGVVCSPLCALRYEGRPTEAIDIVGMHVFGTRAEGEAFDTCTPFQDLVEAQCEAAPTKGG